jgi:hypothetical protein
MDFGLLDFSPTDSVRLVAVAAIVILLALLVISFLSRARVFCQYLKHMTGIELKPATVRKVYRKTGRGGVRDMLISLLIQEDLADPDRVVTPDSKPDTSAFQAGG